MQPFAWYISRLKSMGFAEVLWRAKNKLIEYIDYSIAERRKRPVLVRRIVKTTDNPFEVKRGISGLPFENTESGEKINEEEGEWRCSLENEAGNILKNRLSFFDLESCFLGEEIDWNYEYKAKIKSPLKFAPHIDYRDFRVTGDAKFVWEPSRHQHLVVLGRAYRLTGDKRYAKKVIEQIESWIRQCPFGMGMNWRSPLELAIRLINWVWAYELIEPSGVVSKEHREAVLPIVYRHMWEIARKYSKYSSANNHLIGEAAGVFIGSSYFVSLKESERWRKESRRILLGEMSRQVLDDGGHCELATGYHLFVLEFFLHAGLAARRCGRDFEGTYWNRLEKMFEFVGTLLSGGDQIPRFGDCDDGYVLKLGRQEKRELELMKVAAVLFGRSDFDRQSRGFSETAFWLLGEEGHERQENIGDGTDVRMSTSVKCEESGYYVLKHNNERGGCEVCVTFGCGALGFGSIAAHGHADALSLTLRINGKEILIDPGTYDYFSYPEWRDYFRSTRAHNTVEVDGRNQSEILGPFMWGQRAEAVCVEWEPAEDGGSVCGEHDGYSVLKDPVRHKRRLTLKKVGKESELLIVDELSANEQHEAAVYFHLSNVCRVEKEGEGKYCIHKEGIVVKVEFDRLAGVSCQEGQVEPIMGWSSSGYHRKAACKTLVGKCKWAGHVRLETRFVISGV